LDNSSKIWQNGITAWVHIKSAIYSTLQVLRAIPDSNLLTQWIGPPEYVIIKLALDIAEWYKCMVIFDHEPAKSLST